MGYSTQVAVEYLHLSYYIIDESILHYTIQIVSFASELMAQHELYLFPPFYSTNLSY